MIYDRIALDIAFELLGFDAEFAKCGMLESYCYADAIKYFDWHSDSDHGRIIVEYADREDYMTIDIEANKDMNNIINYVRVEVSGIYGSAVYEANGYEHFPYSF